MRLEGCWFDLPPDAVSFADIASTSLETQLLPCAGGICDQSQQFRQGLAIFARARHEILESLKDKG